MMRTIIPFTIFAASAILATSCAPHKVPPPAEVPPSHSWYWVDLRPGWRVRVVTPITKSGKFLVKAEPLPESHKSGHSTAGAGVFSFKLGKDFIGYEVSLYSVRRRRGGGVRVSFKSATMNISGKKKARPRSVLPLFHLPRKHRFVRVLHLARGSHGDHEAAIVAASSRESLEALARNVVFHASDCLNTPETSCSWVPPGVAVIPEHKKTTGNASQWTAAY